MKLLFVVGTRPNFVKFAPFCRLLRARSKGISYSLVHTGQHYDAALSKVFFRELDLPKPDFFLNVGSGSHARQTGLAMMRLEQLCTTHEYDCMVVFGDVNSTLAAALVGAKLHLPVAHVEAGLRSFNRRMPEEINRLATDHVSDLLFAPTVRALEHLKREGLGERAQYSGDVMLDMVRIASSEDLGRSTILEKLDLQPSEYYLATLHRPSNVDDPDRLAVIFQAMARLDAKLILPAHPRLSNNLRRFKMERPSNVHLIEPLGYLDFLQVQRNALKIITDSGGVQKEAFFLETPCVTLRPETEWPETVEARANILVREMDFTSILEAVASDVKPDFSGHPFGDGTAAVKIMERIEHFLGKGSR